VTLRRGTRNRRCLHSRSFNPRNPLLSPGSCLGVKTRTGISWLAAHPQTSHVCVRKCGCVDVWTKRSCKAAFGCAASPQDEGARADRSNGRARGQREGSLERAFPGRAKDRTLTSVLAGRVVLQKSVDGVGPSEAKADVLINREVPAGAAGGLARARNCPALKGVVVAPRGAERRLEVAKVKWRRKLNRGGEVARSTKAREGHLLMEGISGLESLGPFTGGGVETVLAAPAETMAKRKHHRSSVGEATEVSAA